jgi:hypothetical protein
MKPRVGLAQANQKKVGIVIASSIVAQRNKTRSNSAAQIKRLRVRVQAN